MPDVSHYQAIRAELDAGHPVTGPYDPDYAIAHGQLAITKNITQVFENRVTELGLLKAFADPQDGETCLQKLGASDDEASDLARAA